MDGFLRLAYRLLLTSSGFGFEYIIHGWAHPLGLFIWSIIGFILAQIIIELIILKKLSGKI